jgi:hypothetical protein
MFFRNVGWLLTDYMALYPRRWRTVHDHRCENIKSYEASLFPKCVFLQLCACSIVLIINGSS